ncbi:MAG: hypothetical protein ABI663_00380 [Chryseolinea sp.]
MAKVDFKTSGYFSSTVIVVGIIFSLVGLILLLSNIIGGLILLLIGIVISTTHYRLMIDFDKKIFHDYVWILGLKNGDKGIFEHIEYLFIKKNRVSQNMNMQVATTTIRKEVYDGYLRFSETEKIHLLTKDSKKTVVAKLRELSTMLNVRIIDYSDGEAKEI